jgi:two-component system sensor histidine kinase PilS (NtrC family)
MVLFYGNRAGWTLTSLASSMADPPAELYYRAFLNVFSFFIIAFLSNQLARRLKMAGEEIRQQTHSIEDLKVLNENIIQSVTSGLITTDLDGAITSMNRSAEKILGINKEETSQSDIGVLFPYSEVKEYIKNPGCQGDEFSRFEASFTTQTADTIVLGMTLSLLCDTGGNQRGLLCTFQDLTHFKALEEKMKHNEQLAMIGELSAGIAHEIRNPLASMSGSIQILKAELELDEENKRLMEIILKETDRLNTLIGNFLMYARPRALDCQPVCLNDLIEETVTLLKNGNRMNPSIQIVLEMDEEAQAMADSMAIRQVVWNLATNAIDAMPQGGTLRLDVSREEMGNGPHGGVPEKVVRLTVSDTGGGIDPNIGDKLFFPFLTTKEGGSGLGLAIVHQIVQQHGGWLDVVNDAGQGAAFHLYLPEAAHLVAS